MQMLYSLLAILARVDHAAVSVIQTLLCAYLFDLEHHVGHELSVVCSATKAIVDLATRAFIKNDLELAVKVEPLEEWIDQLCNQVKMNHVDRLQQGKCTIRQGFVLNDLLTSLERVGDHCSNVAVAMIELDVDAFDTHEYIERLRNNQSPEFVASFEEYKKQFAI